jgi:hypothetical protein
MAKLRCRQGDIRSEIAYLKDAVKKNAFDKSRKQLPAMLLADRFIELGSHKEAIGLYDWVMRSGPKDKRVRVTAAMLAGIATARFAAGEADEKVYWQIVLNEFDDLDFFSLQAKFLNGNLSEKEFRLQMAALPGCKATAEYIIGLKHWLNGDTTLAAEAFERCLQIESGDMPRSHYLPHKWAKEDLLRIKKKKSAEYPSAMHDELGQRNCQAVN